MKKELLLIAAAAAMFAACERNDFLREPYSSPESENDGAIYFTSFTDNVVKTKSIDDKAENSEALYTWTFFNHHTNFEVWGFKSKAANKYIFGGTSETSGKGTVVTVSESAGVYSYAYNVKRFWDKTAESYQFYAAAPANAGWTFNYTGATASSFGTGTFETTSTLTGVNLKNVSNSGAGTDLTNTFKGKADVDKLIAAPCVVSNSYYNKPVPDVVHLNFIHILSKLNITISTTLSTDDYTVKLTNFVVKNMPGYGAFNEATTPLADHTTRRNHWTPTTTYDKKIDYATGLDAENALTVDASKKYIVESLVIPQAINYERVALDGGEHALVAATDPVYFTTWEEYTKAKPVEGLTEEQFDVIIAKADADRTADEKTAITKTPAKPQVAAYTAVSNTDAHSSEPYLEITYSINGDEFVQCYNLAAAFLGYNNNSQKKNGAGAYVALEGSDPTSVEFFEGWQNTLNIIINPTAIEFTADVAEWDDALNQNYEIEQGNN